MKKSDFHEKIEKILLINLGGIGDVLLSIPAMRALYKKYPKTTMDLLTVPRSPDTIDNSPYPTSIITFSGSPASKLKLLWLLRRERYDVAINMRSLNSSAGALKMWLLLSFLAPRIRAGRDTEKRGFFYDVKVPESYKCARHEMEYCLDLAARLGATYRDTRMDYRLTCEDMAYADAFLKDNGVTDTNAVIGISAGAPWPAKRWPLERFVEVARKLSEAGLRVLITGSEDERYLEKAFAEKDMRIISAVGRTSVRQLIALIKRCSVFLSNDTGPMHIAAVVGTPVVAVFGSSHLKGFDPRKITDSAVVFKGEAECSPCERKFCPSMKCFDSIKPEEVTAACFELLEKAGDRKSE